MVIDPRRCDVAEKAHVHLQVKPGEDASLLACIIREIIENKWYDAQYVADYVSGFEALYKAVQPFTLDYTQRRTTCPAADIVEAARTFATAASGAALSGTGLHMARHQNLTTQLVQTLNAICGRFDRVGGMTRIAGTLGPELPASGNQPLPVALRTEQRARVRDIQGITGLFGYQEMPTNTLADEILTPGKGQIKALIVNGGNPALVFSDTNNTLKALDELELLVVNDLFLSATARHAHYVIAVKHPFERVDTPMLSDAYFPFSFSQYTPAMVEARDDVIEEWEFFWRLGPGYGYRLHTTRHRRGRDADRRPGDRRPQSRRAHFPATGEGRLAQRRRLRQWRAAGGRRDPRHARSCGPAPGRRPSRGHCRTGGSPGRAGTCRWRLPRGRAVRVSADHLPHAGGVLHHRQQPAEPAAAAQLQPGADESASTCSG